jgi:hypothetical protein
MKEEASMTTDSKEILRTEIERTWAMAGKLGGDAELEQAAAYWEGALMASEVLS